PGPELVPAGSSTPYLALFPHLKITTSPVLRPTESSPVDGDRDISVTSTLLTRPTARAKSTWITSPFSISSSLPASQRRMVPSAWAVVRILRSSKRLRDFLPSAPPSKNLGPWALFSFRPSHAERSTEVSVILL